MRRNILYLAASSALWLLVTACAPTPRPAAVAAVITPEQTTPETTSPAGTDTGAPPTPTQPVLTPEPVFEPTSVPSASPAAGPTPTLHPELPQACAAAPPQSAAVHDRGYEYSICRAAAVSPDGRWLAFAQLTEAFSGDDLWLINRATGAQERIANPAWAGDEFRAVSLLEWSLTNELLIVHKLAGGTSPASAYDPEFGTVVELGSVSNLAWNARRSAVVGWEFRAGCRFTRVVGYDFSANRILQSAAPEEEIVGRVFWLPDDSGYVYSRRAIVGECPGCYYRAAELVLAAAEEFEYTTLISDPGIDYVLLGFQDGKIAYGERAYVYHTCEAPELPPAELAYFLIDPATGEITEYAGP